MNAKLTRGCEKMAGFPKLPTVNLTNAGCVAKNTGRENAVIWKLVTDGCKIKTGKLGVLMNVNLDVPPKPPKP